MRRIYTISSKNSMKNIFSYVLQMTGNLLGVKNQKKFPKRKFLGSKMLKSTSTPKCSPKIYIIVTPVYQLLMG